MPASISSGTMSAARGGDNNNYLDEMMSINDYLCEKRNNEQEDGLLVANVPPRCSSAPPASGTSSSSTTSSHRRFSSRIRFPTKRRLSSLVNKKQESVESSVSNKEMRKLTPSEMLHQIIQNSEKRSILISKLISQRSDCTVRVRLIAAVDEYERTQDQSRQRLKGFKIISMFVSKESMFHVGGIPAGLEQTLLQFKLNKLVDLRAHVLDCLANQDIVAKVMSDLASF